MESFAYDDATNVADLLWDENPAMFLPIDLIRTNRTP